MTWTAGNDNIENNDYNDNIDYNENNGKTTVTEINSERHEKFSEKTEDIILYRYST